MREDLKRRLFEAALAQASNNRININSIIASEVKTFIDKGVEKMSDVDYQSYSRRQIAEENIIRLINEVSREVRYNRIDESLDYRSLTSTLSKVCPLWPFC